MDYFENYNLEDHPDLDGDYEKVPGEYHNNRPVWRHVDGLYVLCYAGLPFESKSFYLEIFPFIEDFGHWMIAPEAEYKKKGSFGIVKSEETERLMLPRGTAPWKYKVFSGWKDVMVNLFDTEGLEEISGVNIGSYHFRFSKRQDYCEK